MTVHSPARRVAAAYAVGAAALLAVLFAWQGDAYVNYAEGVYLFSSRLALDGALPYRDFVAAHPPLLFYSGAAMLALWDSLDGVRVLLGCVSLATGALVAAAVLRLTGSVAGAVAGGVASILAPWSLHEHATLMPETFGAPLVMAAALLAARTQSAVWGGLVASAAIGFKWPFLLPGLALVAATPARGRYAAALLGGFAVGVAVSFAVFGVRPLYDDVVVAQQQIGWHGLREIGGLAVQAAWNLLPLVVPAAAGVALGTHAREPALLRTLVAVAVAGIALVGTIAKTGTYVNVTSLAEPPLVALGAAGVVWLLRADTAPGWRRPALAAVLGGLALGAIQVASFLARPTDPGLFVRPFSAPGHAWVGAGAVGRARRAAAACPPSRPYSGVPFMAFVAGRPMPGDEPDQFLMARAPVAAAHAREAAADVPRCP